MNFVCVLCFSTFSLSLSQFLAKTLSYEGAEPTKDSWTDRVDYGKLKHGKKELIKKVNLCSKYFNVLHKEGLKSGPNMIGKITSTTVGLNYLARLIPTQLRRIKSNQGYICKN